MSETLEKKATTSSSSSKKRRVFQVAKELHVSIESLLEFLQAQNYKVKNPMSSITEDMYEEICREFKHEIAETSEPEFDFRKRLLERREKEQERKRRVAKEILELTSTRPSLEELIPPSEEKVSGEEPTEEQVQHKPKTEAEKGHLDKERLKTLLAAHEKEVEHAIGHDKKPAEVEEKTVSAVEEATTAEVKPEEKEDKAKPVVKGEPTVRVRKIKAGEGETAQKEEKAPEKSERQRRRRKKKERVAEEKAKAAQKVKRKKAKAKRPRASEAEVEATIRKTMAMMEERGKPKRRRVKAAEEEVVEEPTNIIRINEFASVAELAQCMDVDSTEVIKKLMEMGMLATINQRLDMDTIMMVADEFGYEVQPMDEYGVDLLEELEQEDSDNLEPRPPVVTIMGHVDHGKTSLLDYIRKSNIVAGEVGGITQHIGAYVVSVDGKKITFLDTPGHEAFTAMRARGAQITDIVVLIVAADDRVMPQTIEAINHAKAAGVPIIVAINKIDKPTANPELIKKQLSEVGILVEEWGGKYPCTEISAKLGTNVDQLLELITLQAEMLELKANPNRLAKGVILESRLDKGKGPVATVLVQNGTLKVGDPVVAGPYFAKVRAMFDERNRRVEKALPSTPVLTVGFNEVPEAGDILFALKSEREAREISLKRRQAKREQDFRKTSRITLDEFARRVSEKAIKELKLILKTDVAGSAEALSDALTKLSTDEITIQILHQGTGAITETDVLLASASNAIIIGFHVRPNPKAIDLAASQGVDIRTYSVIYDAIDDIKAALEGLLEPVEKEELVGIVEVRQIFKIPKVGTIAGCYVLKGKINRNDKARVVREGKVIHESRISSLKRFKEDVREVTAGFECGIGIENFNDIKVGDHIETYKVVEVKRKPEKVEEDTLT